MSACPPHSAAAGILAICIATVGMLSGCSKSNAPENHGATGPATQSTTADASPDQAIPPAAKDATETANRTQRSGSAMITAANPSSATEVVSEFMDIIRRGGMDRDSDRLLTIRAKQELARIGHRFEPMGSPSARFEVTRAENVPDSPGSALVHSYWAEPLEEPAIDAGGQQRFGDPMQVVWAVQWERSAWRISGLAVLTEPGGEPQILDFENGDAMAAYLSQESIAETPSADGQQQIR